MKNTIIISAFPACGKTYCFNHLQDKYSIADSDSSEFSWRIRPEDNVKVRNEDFPNNYIEHIRSLIGQVDFIFVSSHDVVRKALEENNLAYYLVYPKNTKENKDIWINRMLDRGSSRSMINFIFNGWDKFIEEMDEELFPCHYLLGDGNNGMFLDEKALDGMQNANERDDFIKETDKEKIPYYLLLNNGKLMMLDNI